MNMTSMISNCTHKFQQRACPDGLRATFCIKVGPKAYLMAPNPIKSLPVLAQISIKSRSLLYGVLSIGHHTRKGYKNVRFKRNKAPILCFLW